MRSSTKRPPTPRSSATPTVRSTAARPPGLPAAGCSGSGSGSGAARRNRLRTRASRRARPFCDIGCGPSSSRTRSRLGATAAQKRAERTASREPERKRDGAPLGDEFIVNTGRSGSQLNPEVDHDASGGFVVVWQSYDQDNNNTYGIYGQRYNAAGVAQGGEFLG